MSPTNSIHYLLVINKNCFLTNISWNNDIELNIVEEEKEKEYIVFSHGF